MLAPIPEPIAGEAIAWRKKHVDEADILEPEDEAHVTVRYGLHTTDPDDVARILDNAGPITIRLGETSIFSSDEYDVLKLDVESADLVRLHEMLGTLEHTDTHVDYRPHLTLAYLKPGTGQKYVGDQAFVGAKATIRDVIFSPPAEDAEKSRIALAAPLGPAQWFEDAIRNWPESMSKGNEDQPRDERGRWTSGGGSEPPVHEDDLGRKTYTQDWYEKAGDHLLHADFSQGDRSGTSPLFLKEQQVARNAYVAKYGMSSAEFGAAWAYMGEGGRQFSMLNESLRQGSELSVTDHLMLSGLAKTPAFEGVAFRGENYGGLSDAFDERVGELKVGETITNAGWTSATKDRDLMTRYARGYTKGDGGGSGSITMEIQSHTGRSLDWIDHKEKEVVFAPRTQFRVESVQRQDNFEGMHNYVNYHVRLTEI